jgi:programmed cell death protein 5
MVAYGGAEDPELAELRRRRMREIQDQQGQSMGRSAQEALAQQAELERREAERAEVLRRIMTPDARERLARIRMAKPDVAAAIEQQVFSLAASGRLGRMIDDATLRALLERLMPERREIKITRR